MKKYEVSIDAISDLLNIRAYDVVALNLRSKSYSAAIDAAKRSIKTDLRWACVNLNETELDEIAKDCADWLVDLFYDNEAANEPCDLSYIINTLYTLTQDINLSRQDIVIILSELCAKFKYWRTI
ncbi:MAG: hypothetical protein IKU15_00145 [Clostridia bacterium]|nr:hypothetical protein [Clostridia bacterium]